LKMSDNPTVHKKPKHKHGKSKSKVPKEKEAHKTAEGKSDEKKETVDIVKDPTKENQRKLAIKELIDTEQSYYEDLLVIVSVFMDPLEHYPDICSMITEQDFRAIFSNFSAFPLLHSNILTDFLAEGANVADVLLHYSDFFRMYVMYCNNMDNQHATIDRLREENPDFDDWILTCKKRPECRLQDIYSFLIKPFQRLCRYPLLLHAIIKNSEPGPETDRLKEAEQKISEVMQSINQQKRQSESNAIAVELQERFWNPVGSVPVLISPGRTFIRNGQVTEIELGPNNVLTVDYILCSDLFVRAYKRIGDTRLEIASSTHLADVKFERLDSSYTFPKLGLRGNGLQKECSFKINIKEGKINVIACFSNEEEMNAWFEAFTEAKSALTKKNPVNSLSVDDFEIVSDD